MKILIIMDPGIRVPPIGYGGHERLVEMFAIEYQKSGHEVHLLVTEGSSLEGCKVFSIGKEQYPPTKQEMYFAVVRSWFFLSKNRNEYDLIHNFGRLMYLLPILNHSVKKIMTYGREISARNIGIINKFPNKNLVFTAPSKYCSSTGNVAGKWEIIYNAINFNKYELIEVKDEAAPFIFLSRLERLKGAHEAIKLCLEMNEKLIIAGNISKLPEEVRYFDKEIRPFIDNEKIIYVGTLNDEQKNYYLGKSKAMLFPARTNEAFGMVMVESMACGTPVIAYNHAAMPEIVTNNITGYIVNNQDEMKAQMNKVLHLDRREVRAYAQQRFDVNIIANEYLNLF